MLRIWLLCMVALVVGAVLGVAFKGDKMREVAGPTVTASATVTATEEVPGPEVTRTIRIRITVTPGADRSFSDGTRVVGTDIKPGIYKTSGDSPTGACYWSRNGDLTGDVINENGIVSGPTTVEVLATDRAFETSGGCRWSKIG